MQKFEINSEFLPTGDQPQAIDNLVKGSKTKMNQTLLGVTGSGKTFTVANVIANTGKNALIISHNKTLAAQLYSELKQFFPKNNVGYFVSYYDYYQPESYLPQTDTYYDSKLGNDLTKTLCKQAFDVLYDAIMNDKPENYPYGSMLSGMGFGNCSTTLGHALSYVFSNEGVPHGYSLSSCTTVAHKHNKSIFYDRFKEIIEKMGFDKLELKADVDQAADVVMTDKGHLDPNPIPISKEDVVKCLNDIKAGNL